MARERSACGAWVHTVDICGLDTDTEQLLSMVGLSQPTRVIDFQD
jgi:hypothetical protein